MASNLSCMCQPQINQSPVGSFPAKWMHQVINHFCDNSFLSFSFASSHYYILLARETPDDQKVMSGPASTSARVLLDGHHPHRSRHSYHHHHTPNNSTPPTPPPAVAEQPPAVQPSSTPSSSSPPSSALARDYRKGNWTLHETLIMINAKRLDNERPVLRQCRGDAGTSRTVELRWKWVENHCWKNGCLRSQNQCNDKWDNLLRDYRKVRDYEEKATSVVEAFPSYWAMEKHERKERNLPSNIAAEVFDALTDVLSRRNAQRSGVGASATPVSSRLPPHLLPPPSVPPPPPQEQPAPPPPLLPPQTQPTVSGTYAWAT